MFSKFSVFSKFLKYTNLKQNLLWQILEKEYRGAIYNCRFYTTKEVNLLFIPLSFNILPMTAKRRTYLQIMRSLGCSNGRKGDGENQDNNDTSNKRKSLEIRSKKILRKRLKCLKESNMCCKRYRRNKLQDSVKVNTESKIPHDAVCVKFMKSKNVKKFRANQSLPVPVKTPKAYQMQIYKKQDQSTSIAKLCDANKILISLKNENSMKSLFDVYSAKIGKQFDQGKIDALVTNTNLFLFERNLLLTSLFNNFTRCNENTRIFLMARLNKSTQGKIPICISQDKLPQTLPEGKQKKDTIPMKKTSVLPDRESLLTVLFNNTKVQSSQIKKPTKFAQKKFIQNQEHNTLNTQDNNAKRLKDFISPAKHVVKKPDEYERVKEVIKNSVKKLDYLNSDKWSANTTTYYPKNYIAKYKLHERRKTPQPKLRVKPKNQVTPQPLPKNGTIPSMADKLTTSNNQANGGNYGRDREGTRSTKGTTILATDQLIKINNSTGGGNYNGGRTDTSSTKAVHNSRFWRFVSIAVLPFIMGITTYVISNMVALEIFKRMRNARPSVESVSMTLLPAIHEENFNQEELAVEEMEMEGKDENKS